ncbi:hypothetical protein [Sporosarcina koreensis]|uniref:hypothetical protein n=1 Tax=Sporosarcina koreensis TaxID=334735 RepID=UPI001181C45E|nr:hypothetical protein [Sporosarcina koreensis]
MRGSIGHLAGSIGHSAEDIGQLARHIGHFAECIGIRTQFKGRPADDAPYSPVRHPAAHSAAF